MAINSSVSARISVLRTLLILFVVFLHIGGAPMSEFDYSNPIQFTRFFLQDVLGRLAVPTLSVVTGYLLFSSGLDLDPLRMYRKKFRSLVVPFLFFNVIYFAIQYGIEYSTGWGPLFSLVGRPPSALINNAISYDNLPLNTALHFLRDLIILVVLAPIFGYFLRRHAATGLAIVICVFLSDLEQNLVNRNTMAVLFYLGGWAAISKFDLNSFDHVGKYTFPLLLAVYLGTMYFDVKDYTLVYLIAPFAVWPTASLLIDTRAGLWLVENGKYSFFLFLAHSPMIHVASLTNSKMFSGEVTNAFVFITFVIVVTTTFALYDLAMKLMPGTFSFIIGGRSPKILRTAKSTATLENSFER